MYVPPGSLSKEATITIEGGIQSYPAAQGYGISTVASVSLGTAKVDSAIVLEFDASPNSIVLHQVDNEWIPVPTTVRGGKAYGVAHSASLFAVAELAPMPQLKTLSGPCFVLGFTGWKADPNIALLATPLNLFALDSIPDFLEARSERDEINADSGVNQLVQNAILNGLEPSQFLMLRHYEWNQPGGGIESVYREADRGDRIVLLGHSAGGAAALHVAWELRANGIPVELLVELDTYIGWPPNYPWLTADGRSAPKNVIRGVNYYQTMGVESPLGGVLPLYSGRVQSYGSDGNHSGSNLAPVPHGQVPIWVAATQDLAIEALLDACAPGEQVAIEDSDGDGIPNSEDNCDNDSGPVSNQGCPVPLDSDGDGIPDSEDNCDNDPGPVSNRGCPVPLDSDGDGIPDSEDNCDNDPGPASNKGCPVPPTCPTFGSEMISPIPGSQLSDSTVLFAWSAGDSCLDYYDLWVGTGATSGTATSIYDRPDGPELSQSVSEIPNCTTIYVRLTSSQFGVPDTTFSELYSYKSYCPSGPGTCSPSGSFSLTSMERFEPGVIEGSPPLIAYRFVAQGVDVWALRNDLDSISVEVEPLLPSNNGEFGVRSPNYFIIYFPVGASAGTYEAKVVLPGGQTACVTIQHSG